MYINGKWMSEPEVQAYVSRLENKIQKYDKAISRDIELIDWLRTMPQNRWISVKDMKSADVKPVKQWVKLHDKHPDTEGFYLVCDQYGECEVVEYLPDIKSWFTHKIKGEIQYWMPLPDPPKDGET